MELRPEENESEDPAKLQILNRQLSMDSGTLLRRAHRNKPISGVGLVNYRAGYGYRYRKGLSIQKRIIDTGKNIGPDFCPKLAASASVFSRGWKLVRQADSQFLGRLRDVLITTSGQIYNDHRILGHGGCTLDGSRYGMGALQGRDNPLHLG